MKGIHPEKHRMLCMKTPDEDGILKDEVRPYIMQNRTSILIVHSM
jgi:hypothetical protein